MSWFLCRVWVDSPPPEQRLKLDHRDETTTPLNLLCFPSPLLFLHTGAPLLFYLPAATFALFEPRACFCSATSIVLWAYPSNLSWAASSMLRADSCSSPLPSPSIRSSSPVSQLARDISGLKGAGVLRLRISSQSNPLNQSCSLSDCMPSLPRRSRLFSRSRLTVKSTTRGVRSFFRCSSTFTPSPKVPSCASNRVLLHATWFLNEFGSYGRRPQRNSWQTTPRLKASLATPCSCRRL
mmetsp:Transcript_37636/g.65308  ORF Transcript_37636/g.65308 Transcript_37636/m.65308 type:complete len:238 (-) Transcript_37636:785-1498(-)